MLVLLPRLFILLLLLLPLSLSTNIKFTPGDNSGAGEVSPQHEPPRTNAISTSFFATRFAHRSGHMLTRSFAFASFRFQLPLPLVPKSTGQRTTSNVRPTPKPTPKSISNASKSSRISCTVYYPLSSSSVLSVSS